MIYFSLRWGCHPSRWSFTVAQDTFVFVIAVRKWPHISRTPSECGLSERIRAVLTAPRCCGTITQNKMSVTGRNRAQRSHQVPLYLKYISTTGIFKTQELKWHKRLNSTLQARGEIKWGSLSVYPEGNHKGGISKHTDTYTPTFVPWSALNTEGGSLGGRTTP